MPIRFTYGDETWLHYELLGPEIEQLEERLGVNYTQLTPLSNMRHKLACLAVFLRRNHGEDEVAEILNRPLKELEEMVTWEADDDLPDDWQDGVPDPKAADTATTSGSSDSPEPPSTGLPTLPDVNVSVT